LVAAGDQAEHHGVNTMSAMAAMLDMT
jgi:hypothetical protein